MNTFRLNKGNITKLLNGSFRHIKNGYLVFNAIKISKNRIELAHNDKMLAYMDITDKLINFDRGDTIHLSLSNADKSTYRMKII